MLVSGRVQGFFHSGWLFGILNHQHDPPIEKNMQIVISDDFLNFWGKNKTCLKPPPKYSTAYWKDDYPSLPLTKSLLNFMGSGVLNWWLACLKEPHIVHLAIRSNEALKKTKRLPSYLMSSVFESMLGL